jgi:hypothetical protein
MTKSKTRQRGGKSKLPPRVPSLRRLPRLSKIDFAAPEIVRALGTSTSGDPILTNKARFRFNFPLQVGTLFTLFTARPLVFTGKDRTHANKLVNRYPSEMPCYFVNRTHVELDLLT